MLRCSTCLWLQTRAGRPQHSWAPPQVLRAPALPTRPSLLGTARPARPSPFAPAAVDPSLAVEHPSHPKRPRAASAAVLARDSSTASARAAGASAGASASARAAGRDAYRHASCMLCGPCESLDVSHASHTLRQLSHGCVSLRSDTEMLPTSAEGTIVRRLRKVQSTRASVCRDTSITGSSQAKAEKEEAQTHAHARSFIIRGIRNPACLAPIAFARVPTPSQQTQAVAAVPARCSAAERPRFVHYSSLVRHASPRCGWPPATSRAWRRTSRATRVSAWSS